MSGTTVSRPARSARSARRALAWEATKEYASGALWVLPSLAALLALGGRVRDVPDPGVDRLAAGPLRLPGHRRRRPHAADHGEQHGGHGDRAGPRPHRRRPAAVLHRLLAPAAAQLPAGPGHPGGAERLHRHLRLQRRRAVHRRPVRGRADRGVPAAGHQRLDPAAVREPGHGGVLRRPPDALDPDRRDQPPRGGQHPPGPRRPARSRPSAASPRGRRSGRSPWSPASRATCRPSIPSCCCRSPASTG